LRASLPVSDTVTLMYMLTNGIQQTEDQRLQEQTLGRHRRRGRDVDHNATGQEQPTDARPDGFFSRVRLRRSPGRSASARTSTSD
jgi:hypothetical protein